MTLTQDISAENPTAPTAVLDRMNLILESFDGTDSLSLAEVVSRTRLPRSSAHRMLERLVSLRWLDRQGRGYRLGLGLIELGSRAVRQDRVHSAAGRHLHHLYRISGMVVHLAVLDGDDVVYLDKIGGRLAPLVPTRIGGRRPARLSALGNALLAYGGRTLPGDDEIRERGAAVERNGSLRGFGCIASPIGEIGDAAAAVSICGPLREMSFDSTTINSVRLTAAAIARSMSDDGVHLVPTLQRRSPMRQMPTAPRVLCEG